MMAITPVTVEGRKLGLHKSLVAPQFRSRTVLTREPWSFVGLSLRRQGEAKALFYWDQAKTFYEASRGLPAESAPLLLYYSYMNAAKALLEAKKIAFDPYHGVAEWKTGANARDLLKTLGVKLKPTGVLPSLALHLGDAEQSKQHSLQELFFNMPFIHRTYCLTYPAQRDMYVPLRDCVFVRDSNSGDAYLTANVAGEYPLARIVSRLPPSLIADQTQGPSGIRSKSAVPLTKGQNPTDGDLTALTGLNRAIRADVFFINGTQTLWYAKLITKGPTRLARHNPTLVLAAMHRLSELCRYHPMDFAKHLSGPSNWLLHEFIGMSPSQYIDEISAEITGHTFLIPNARPTA